MGGAGNTAPHPFTFAGQHVRIGAAAGRFWGITLSGMTLDSRSSASWPAPARSLPCSRPGRGAHDEGPFSSSRRVDLCRSIHSICSASTRQPLATSSNALLADRSFACAARFVASAALCRYISARDDMKGEQRTERIGSSNEPSRDDDADRNLETLSKSRSALCQPRPVVPETSRWLLVVPASIGGRRTTRQGTALVNWS